MTNVLVRDLDLNLHDHVDARRLDIVADGLPLFGGVQLAIDTTLVSAVRQDGTPRPGATVRDGVTLREARRSKERVYPGLTGVGGRARLVVIAGEVGGRWSSETAHFLPTLAAAKGVLRSTGFASPRAHGLETEMGEYFKLCCCEVVCVVSGRSVGVARC